MDSLTQMALGAAVGTLVAGKTHGRKAALIGAICGTLPDLDVFIPLGDDVSNFTYHRGISHSILFCVLITPILVFLFSKIKWFGVVFKDKRNHLTIFAVLITHIFLDALTIYGTQIFWPLTTPPVGIGSVFIIDPLYTVPLLIGVIGFLSFKSLRLNKVMLMISTLYLLWGLGAQAYVSNLAHQTQDRKEAQILVQTTPFNTFLWRILIMEEEGYKVGYYSIFDKSSDITFETYQSAPSLIEPIQDSFAVQRLKWFTKGFYGVQDRDGLIVMSDLRMGLEPDQYAFSFVVGRHASPVEAVENYTLPRKRGYDRLNRLWDRIWDEDVAF